MTRRTRGAAAAEFLAIIGVFLAVAAGVIDFGWYFAERGRLAVAVAEGARAGADLFESPGVTYGSEIVAAAEGATRAALADAGLACDGACAIEVHLDTVDDVAVLSVSVLVPWSPIVGLTPVPSHLFGRYVIAPRDQGPAAPPGAT